MYNENFMGINGFLWFTGVVEDCNDPLKAGRVRVRIVGSHTSDLIQLPTSELPWCLVMLPVTSSGVSGIGWSATGLLTGSWVFGFYRDGIFKQEPCILGSLPGRPINAADPARGFNDPNGIYPKYINEPDVNRLAVNDPKKPHPSLAIDESNRSLNVLAYNSQWDQPATTYNAVYPHNQVYESESGHIVEFDDTPGAARIHIRHNSGTSIEIDTVGNTVAVTRGNNYLIIDKDNKVYIQGNSDITVNGDSNIRAGGNVGILANGNADIVAGGTISLSADDMMITANVTIDGNLNVSKDTTLSGNNQINGYTKP